MLFLDVESCLQGIEEAFANDGRLVRASGAEQESAARMGHRYIGIALMGLLADFRVSMIATCSENLIFNYWFRFIFIR